MQGYDAYLIQRQYAYFKNNKIWYMPDTHLKIYKNSKNIINI